MAYQANISVTNISLQPALVEVISAVRNAFLSCSFTRVPQSGSVDDLTTLGVRSTGNQQITYDVFAFTDPLQSVTPLFVRIRYMSGGAAGSIQLGVQMGNAHNSSGSLTGLSATAEMVSTNVLSISAVSGATVTASGDGSYISLMNVPQDTRSGQVIVCERLVDVNGQPMSGGFHLLATTGGTTTNSFRSQVSYSGSAPAPVQSNGPVFLKSTTNPSIFDGRLVLGLIFPYAGIPLNPTINMLLSTTSEVSPYQLVKYTMYGVERTYRNFTNNSLASSDIPFTGYQILIRED